MTSTVVLTCYNSKTSGPGERELPGPGHHLLRGDDVAKVTRACPCGAAFETTEKRLLEGRGRYCSPPCMYRFRPNTRKGVRLTTHVRNRAWFQPGRTPHNAGTRKPRVRKGRRRGAAHPGWKGDAVTYAALHHWIERTYQKVAACEHCGCTDKPLDWANKTGEYRRERDDWLNLCRSCHIRYDFRRRTGRLP